MNCRSRLEGDQISPLYVCKPVVMKAALKIIDCPMGPYYRYALCARYLCCCLLDIPPDVNTSRTIFDSDVTMKWHTPRGSHVLLAKIMLEPISRNIFTLALLRSSREHSDAFGDLKKLKDLRHRRSPSYKFAESCSFFYLSVRNRFGDHDLALGR